MVAYLDRLRELGVSERMVEGERDGWILIAARWPDRIPEWMPEKFAQLENPQVVRLYRVLGDVLEADADDATLEEAADILVELIEQASARGELDNQDEAFDDQPFVDLLDALVVESAPQGERLLELMRERGWTGWTKPERTGDHRLSSSRRPAHRRFALAASPRNARPLPQSSWGTPSFASVLCRTAAGGLRSKRAAP